MNDLIISFSEDLSAASIEAMNEISRRIFRWVCFTMNESGHVPHVYKCKDDSLEFVIRKVNGNKMKMRWDLQRRMVSLANYVFRVKQNHWPLRVVEDIVGDQYMTYFVINAKGKWLHVDESVVDTNEEDLTTENHSGLDHQELHQELNLHG